MGQIEGYQLLAYEWAWFAIMTIMVFARLYVRVHLCGGPFQWESWRWSDIFILLSWTLRIPIVVGDCFYNAWDGYRVDYIAMTPVDELIKRHKLGVAIQLLYFTIFILIKCAMLCLFAEFVPKVLKKVWWFLRVTAGIVVLHGLACVIVCLNWCKPISSMWDGPIPSCGIGIATLEIWFSGHIFTDFLIIIIPFFILSLLKNLTFGQRLLGFCMFGLGFIAIGCAFANCITMIKAFQGPLPPTAQQLTAFQFTSITEPPLAICIACMPPLRLLFTRSGREKIFGSPKGSRADSDTIVEPHHGDLEASRNSRLTKSSEGKDDIHLDDSRYSKDQPMLGQRIIEQM